jgi:hypothetical protein
MADEEKKSSHFAGKIVATVFGAVLAPILVAVAVKWADPSLWTPKPTSQGNTPTPTTQAPPPPPWPSSPVHLVQKNLQPHFYSYNWNEKRGAESGFLKVEGVHGNFFKFLPDPPHIHASGWTGGLVTRKEAENYTLTVEYRWTGKSDRPLQPRQASILVNASGTDYSYQEPWPQSIKVMLSEGYTGSIQLLGQPDTIQASARFKETKTKETTKEGKEIERVRREYDPSATPANVVSGKPESTGWNNIIYRAGAPEKAPERVPPKPPAKADEPPLWHPPGDPTNSVLTAWNRIIITCNSNTGEIKVRVNNTDVNEIKILSPSQKKGRIVFANDLSEIDFRHIDVEPLPK